MRSSRFVRCIGVAAAALTIFTGALSIASAQDATADPTEDAMMSNMNMMKGACPQGTASKWLEKMSDMMMTQEPGMMATEDMGMMMTEEPGMMATEEMGNGLAGARCLVTQVQGSNEVPGPGDDDATGVALFSIDAASGTVCYDIAVANITLPANVNHIHVGEAGVAGDPVITLPTAPDASGLASGCTTADPALAQQIIDNPAGYYYNVHTSDFPDGAGRGQLMTWGEAMRMMHSMGMDTSDMDMGMDDTGTEPMATEESSG
jgi:hypothetical protein